MKRIYALLAAMIVGATLFITAPANAGVYLARNAETCQHLGSSSQDFNAHVCLTIYYREDSDGTGIKLDQVAIEINGSGWYVHPDFKGESLTCVNKNNIWVYSRFNSTIDVSTANPDFGTLNLFPNVSAPGTGFVTCELTGGAAVGNSRHAVDVSTTAT